MVLKYALVFLLSLLQAPAFALDVPVVPTPEKTVAAMLQLAKVEAQTADHRLGNGTIGCGGGRLGFMLRHAEKQTGHGSSGKVGGRSSTLERRTAWGKPGRGGVGVRG